jgi:hypothetical protein
MTSGSVAGEVLAVSGRLADVSHELEQEIAMFLSRLRTA